MLHLHNNVIVTWKSFEIWPILQEISSLKVQTMRILNPVYVPVNQLQQFLEIPPAQFELKIAKCLRLVPNSKQLQFVCPTQQFAMTSSYKRQASPIDMNTRKSSSSHIDDMTFENSASRHQTSLNEEGQTGRDHQQQLQEETHSSLFLGTNNTNYKLVIRMPSIEYSIPS